jgi:hypothetical protein
MMWWYGPGWGGWAVMTLMMLIFWGALILGGGACAVPRSTTALGGRRAQAQVRPGRGTASSDIPRWGSRETVKPCSWSTSAIT